MALRLELPKKVEGVSCSSVCSLPSCLCAVSHQFPPPALSCVPCSHAHTRRPHHPCRHIIPTISSIDTCQSRTFSFPPFPLRFYLLSTVSTNRSLNLTLPAALLDYSLIEAADLTLNTDLMLTRPVNSISNSTNHTSTNSSSPPSTASTLTVITAYYLKPVYTQSTSSTSSSTSSAVHNVSVTVTELPTVTGPLTVLRGPQPNQVARDGKVYLSLKYPAQNATSDDAGRVAVSYQASANGQASLTGQSAIDMHTPKRLLSGEAW